jgi:hypothetical protein
MSCEGCTCEPDPELAALECAIEAICVERGGKCACEPCRCEDVAKDGEW